MLWWLQWAENIEHGKQQPTVLWKCGVWKRGVAAWHTPKVWSTSNRGMEIWSSEIGLPTSALCDPQQKEVLFVALSLLGRRFSPCNFCPDKEGTLSASFPSEAKSKASFCSYDKAIQKKITPLPRPSHLIEQHLYSSYLLVSQSYPGEDLCLSLLSCPETDWSNHITLSSPACQRTTKCCFVVCLFLLKCHYSLLVTFKNQAIARSMQLCLLYFRDWFLGFTRISKWLTAVDSLWHCSTEGRLTL